MPMTKLSVNVNKVATLRNTRTIGIPSVVHAARLCLDAGAHGITVHPRPDQRHIRPQDVYDLAELIRDHYPHAEFNIEGNPLIEYMHFIEAVRPTQCTLVPDEREAFTSNHGWRLREVGIIERLRPLVRRLKELGCRVSLFMDPIPEDMELAREVGADRIEMYTEPYAAAFARGDPRAAEPYAATARRAAELGLGVNAGHDLNLQNLPPLLKAAPQIAEVSIGHALIADALEFGLPETVRKYLRACEASVTT
ncbi:pyridoxine 5'-phosphate synthase [Fontivita pretiosa]|uniref:pyridoxine 5'-phosphate synthase n=1 Tax=Fontivita pretiosa TaxID=2989684 RepID=UPI003D186E0C